jgi:hypothetical protein
MAYKHLSSLVRHKRVCSASAAASAAAAVDLSVGDIFWEKCPGYPWWPCMLIGRRLTTEKTQTPHSKIVGTTKMWCALLFGGHEYTWVATGGLIAYTRRETNDVPSFMSHIPEWNMAVDEANKLINKSTKDKMKHFIKMFKYKCYDSAQSNNTNKTISTTTSAQLTS